MKVKVDDWFTDISLEAEEMRTLCKPGEGADTCIWLLLGTNGFECACLHKPSALLKRWKNGETVAKRDGCDFVQNLDVRELGIGTHTIEVE